MGFTIEQFKEWVNETFPDNVARAIAENNFRDGLAKMADYVFETNSAAYIQESIAQAEGHAIAANEKLTATQQLKNDVEQLKNQMDSNSVAARVFQDSWNIITNTPNLSALSLNNTTDKGKFWKVAAGAGGSTSITGAAVLAKEGDEFTWNGTKWVHTGSNFIIASKNLANPSTYTDGSFIETNGSILASALYGYTDYIPVIAGQTYTGRGTGNGMRKTCFYNSSKTVVTGGSTNTITTFTVPAGVTYVRVSYFIGDKSTFQFEMAAAASNFEAYGYKASGYKTGADLITQDANHRMVGDGQIASWDQKVNNSDVVNGVVGKSKNLFETSNVVANGVIDTASGSFLTIAGWIRTGSIPIDPESSYIISGLPGRASKAIRFENTAGDFISYQAPLSGVANTYIPLTTPANAAKMYVTLQRDNEVVDLNLVQVEKGTVVTSYVPYNAGRNVVQSIKGVNIPVKTINSRTGDANGAIVLSAADVGLGAANNTADIDKPISTAQQAALDAKLSKGLLASEIIGTSRNLADLSKFTDGSFVSGDNGVIYASASYGYTDYIEVVEGKTYSGRGTGNGMRHVAFYNASKTFVGGYSANTISFNVPAGVKYVRVSYYIADKSSFQFEKATAPTAYTVFAAGSKVLHDIDGATIPHADTLTLENASKILITGCSYEESTYTQRGKSWINKLSNVTDWMVANVGVGGFRIIDIVDRLRKDTSTYLVKPSTFRPTYVFLGNNGNEYFPNNGENLDLYEEQYKIAIEAVHALGAKPIIGTNYHVNNNRYVESGLKNFAERNKINYFGIGLNGEKIMSSGFQGFWSGSHPGVRTNAFIWQEFNYYLEQLHRPEKSIKIFRPRASVTVDTLNYDTIAQRMERFIEINVGEKSLNESNDSEAYYDRLNEGTTVDPGDENNIVTNYTSQSNSNEYAVLINGGTISFTDLALIELIINRVQVEKFVVKIKGDEGLSFYVKNNNDPSAYESTGRDRELVFEVTEAVYNGFAYAVGTKFTSPGVKNSTVQFAYSGKLKSYAMGKGWFLCFTADSDVAQSDRVAATVKLVRVSDSVETATIRQKTAYRYGYSFFANMYKPKGKWNMLGQEVTYAAGVYTIVLSGYGQFFQFDKLKLLASKTGTFAIGGISAEYAGGKTKPSYTKQVEQKAYGTELITTRGFDANWITTGGWSDNGNALVSMPVGVRDYPPYLTTTNHVELGFDANGFSRKISRTITLPVTGTARRGWQKVIVRVVARLFPKIYNPAITGDHYSSAPVITKSSYDLGVLCIGFRATTGSYPEMVLRKHVDIGWSELTFETTLPPMESSLILDLWRDCEVSNVNPSYPLQVYDVSFQIV